MPPSSSRPRRPTAAEKGKGKAPALPAAAPAGSGQDDVIVLTDEEEPGSGGRGGTAAVATTTLPPPAAPGPDVRAALWGWQQAEDTAALPSTSEGAWRVAAGRGGRDGVTQAPPPMGGYGWKC